MALIWFVVVSALAILVWRLIVHDKKENKKNND